MRFQSLLYMLFLAASALVHARLSPRLRTPFLLALSWFFYALWEPRFLALLLAVTAVSFALARAMRARPERKKRFLVLGLVFTLGMLFVFKYLGFFTAGLSSLLAACGFAPLSLPKLLLPAGISFFSFAVSGYLIDVYRGTAEPERNFIDYALFVSFFPAVLSGPIERANHLLPQLRARRAPDGDDLRAGSLRFLLGLTKKLLIADRLAILVNAAYAAPETFTGAQLLLAILCYSVQIYCDFSAYTDMAVGSARLLGVRLFENFDAPYSSRSVKEFWRRWHISLSFWFRDYLYFPLGGSRKGKLRTYVNLMIVFAVSGLWHGAAWTFIVWGLLNGAYQVFGALTLPARRSLRASLRIREDSRLTAVWQTLVTFLLTTAAWVFFRADSLPQALLVLRRVVTLAGGVFPLRFQALGMNRPALIFTALSVLTLAALDRYGQDRLCLRLENTAWRRWAFCAGLVLLTLIFGAYGPGYNAQDFVYFKF